MGGILKGGEKLRVNPLVEKKPERTLLGMPPLTNPVTVALPSFAFFEKKASRAGKPKKLHPWQGLCPRQTTPYARR